ncbi:MAG: hypothetical protein R2712_02020 [Vicinamibacterales bacterium]
MARTPREIAITRNASESLQIAQMGLSLEPGDEILTTEQDYGRMLTTWTSAHGANSEGARIDFPCPTTRPTCCSASSGPSRRAPRVLHFCPSRTSQASSLRRS